MLTRAPPYSGRRQARESRGGLRLHQVMAAAPMLGQVERLSHDDEVRPLSPWANR